MRRLLNVVVSLVVLFGLVFGTVELVRMANGDFAGDYKLNGTFPRAGEGLHPGSAVVFRGVQVGSGLDHQPVPEPGAGDGADRAVVQGAGGVDGDDPAGQPVRRRAGRRSPRRTRTPTPAPTCRRGRPSPTRTSSDELGDLFAAATPLLNQINTNQLSTVLGELAQASQGEGRRSPPASTPGRSWPACSTGR